MNVDLPDIIILGGSPGTGKSTLMNNLHKHFLYPPKIEFSDIRNLYLDPQWQRQSVDEEIMAFDILLYALKKILDKNSKPILLTDFEDWRLASFQHALGENNYRIITLYAEQDEIIKERIQTRNDGFKNVEKAVIWNNEVKTRDALLYEDKIKIDNLSETALLERCLEILSLS